MELLAFQSIASPDFCGTKQIISVDATGGCHASSSKLIINLPRLSAITFIARPLCQIVQLAFVSG